MSRRLARPLLYSAMLAVGAGLAFSAAIAFASPGRAETTDAQAAGVRTLSVGEDKIRALITGAGWVSPGLSKSRWIYMVSFRSCPDCIRFESEVFPALHKAGVDTRVIVIARRARSTAPERTGVGELWARRDWKTFETWTGMPVDAWTGEGYPSGDLDPARAALVEKARQFVDDLRPLLADNGVDLRYPTLIWQGRDGHLRGCACETRETYPALRTELGLPQN